MKVNYIVLVISVDVFTPLNIGNSNYDCAWQFRKFSLHSDHKK